jgi:hypothetical protein
VRIDPNLAHVEEELRGRGTRGHSPGIAKYSRVDGYKLAQLAFADKAYEMSRV